MTLEYMFNDQLSTKIMVDYKNKTVNIINFTDDILERAFGINENPTFQDYERFLESRCFPRSRDHVKWLLNDLGLDTYNPLEIIKKTQGRMAEDFMWIRFAENLEDTNENF